jgi:hypothetical protein
MKGALTKCKLIALLFIISVDYLKGENLCYVCAIESFDLHVFCYKKRVVFVFSFTDMINLAQFV